MDAADVARIGYHGLRAGKTLVIPGFGNQLLPLAPRIFPREWVSRMVRWIQERGGRAPMDSPGV